MNENNAVLYTQYVSW